MLRQLSRIALAYPPKISDGDVGPQGPAIGHLIQLRDAHPVLIRRNVLGHNVHSHLPQVEVGPDSRRCGDPGRFQHIQNHSHGQLPGVRR